MYSSTTTSRSPTTAARPLRPALPPDSSLALVTRTSHFFLTSSTGASGKSSPLQQRRQYRHHLATVAGSTFALSFELMAEFIHFLADATSNDDQFRPEKILHRRQVFIKTDTPRIPVKIHHASGQHPMQCIQRPPVALSEKYDPAQYWGIASL